MVTAPDRAYCADEVAIPLRVQPLARLPILDLFRSRGVVRYRKCQTYSEEWTYKNTPSHHDANGISKLLFQGASVPDTMTFLRYATRKENIAALGIGSGGDPEPRPCAT
jgi:hypothetical protein